MADDKKKKPLKNKSRHFPGMKKQPKIGKPKQPKKKYGPFSKFGKIKPGMSEFQKKSMAQFMKVRDGETEEQWKKRTARRRVKEIDEVKELYLMHPLRVKLRSRERNAIAVKNKYIIVQPIEREFDFMRYYGIVSNYYSIKHGIRKEDLEVGFYFYTNIPFTRDRFENTMMLVAGTKANRLNRWIKDGLLEELAWNKKQYNGPTKTEKTHLYRLTRNFIDKLTSMYRTLGKMNTISTKQPLFAMLSKEEKQVIQDMNDEIQDILTGRKPQEKL